MSCNEQLDEKTRHYNKCHCEKICMVAMDNLIDSGIPHFSQRLWKEGDVTQIMYIIFKRNKLQVCCFVLKATASLRCASSIFEVMSLR